MADSMSEARSTNGAHIKDEDARRKSQQLDEAVDDGDAFPRKKRRKLTIDERKRAVRACDGCRKVKEKCEISQGAESCRRCTHLRRACKFSELPQRDAVPGSQHRRSDSGQEDLASRVKYLEGILKAKQPNASLDTDSLRRRYDELKSPRRSAVASNAQSDAADDEDDLNLDEEKIEIRPVDHNVAHYSGEFSYWNFSMKIKKHVEDWIANPHDRKGSKELPEYWRPSELSLGSSNIKSALQALPPPYIADFLIKVFFKYAQRNYFYVDRRWLARQIDIAYNDAWSSSIKDPGTVAIIFGVLAVGTQYAHMDAGDKEAVPSEDEVGTMFYQTATRLLPEIIQTSSLESVQATTLLGLYALPLDASGLSYVYYSIAIRLAIQNGMHRKYQGTELSAVAIETRNRVWWTACSVEKKIGVFHGRPMSVLRSDIDADFPKDIPEMPDDDGPLSIERMVISIKLIHYLEDFMTEIQHLRKRDKKDLGSVVSKLSEMRTDLTNWWDSIPETAFNVDRSLDGQAFRSCMHLRLLYCLIRMFIGRPFLFTGGRFTDDSPASPPDARKSHSQTGDDVPRHPKTREGSTTSTIDGKKRPSRRLALVQETINAAVEALELCRTLFDGHEGLARASYIEYSACRASMLALIAFSIQEQTDQYRSIMQKGVEMVREMSNAGNSAKAESTLIEALERAVARLQMFSAGWQKQRVSTGHGGSASTPRTAQQAQVSNYDRFRNWQQNFKRGSNSSQSGQATPSNINNQSASTSMPPPMPNWDHNSQPTSTPSGTMPLEGMLDYTASPFPATNTGASPNTNTTGFVIPHAPASDASGLTPHQQNNNPQWPNAAAEQAFYQTLSTNTLPADITPSAAAVNGWLTQARPERQVLDQFLAMPDGEFEGMVLGYGPGSFDGETGWWDLPGTGMSGSMGGGTLPGFGGW